MKRYSYTHTKISCYLGYTSQAISFSIPPLFFAIFNTRLNMSLSQIAFVIFMCFIIQLIVDAVAVKYVDRIGYRKSMIAGQITAASGLLFLGILPEFMENSYLGFFIAAVFYSIGCGITEVIVSPIIEYLPTKNKAAEMSLLHSSYSWGTVIAILATSFLLVLFGRVNWFVIPVLWALIPFYNIYLCFKVPFPDTIKEHERTRIKDILLNPMFITAMIVMACAGASEHVIFQWASYFAEIGLNLPKVTGDLIGPCMFGVLSGMARLWFGKYGNKKNLSGALVISGMLCTGCYICIVFSPVPLISVIACGVCGLATGLMWPGTLSLTSQILPKGGTAMFGLLAMAGDLGISCGTWLTGTLGELYNLKFGFTVSLIFPIILLIGLFVIFKNRDHNQRIINHRF